MYERVVYVDNHAIVYKYHHVHVKMVMIND